MNNIVIAIARTFGSKGKQVGVALSEALGIPCYDNQILDMASQQSGINEAAFYNSNEKLRYASLKKLLVPTPRDYIVKPSSSKFISDDNLFNIQSEIIRNLADNESCIIMGKSAGYILAGRPNVVSVFITAPEADCVSEIASRMKVSEAEAVTMVRRTNRYRRQYCEYYSHGEKWDSPVYYDLCINTAKTGKEAAVRMILDYAREKASRN